MSAPVRTICAWCKVLIHDGVLVDGLASHGACKACADRLRKDANQHRDHVGQRHQQERRVHHRQAAALDLARSAGRAPL